MIFEITPHAHHQGGKLRIGFENSVFLSNGEIARDNAEKITDLCRNLAQGAVPPHA
ncbi:MAG: 3-keto-5-aminohexanoate cleavage protein [Paracoccaceae bacterium]